MLANINRIPTLKTASALQELTVTLCSNKLY